MIFRHVVAGLLIAAPAAALGGRRERAQFLAARRDATAEGAAPVLALHAGGAGGNPMGKGMMASGAGSGGDTEVEKKGEKKAAKFQKKWLSFWYWKPLVASMMYLLVTVDVGGPLMDSFVGFSLQSEVFLLSACMYGFAIVVLCVLDPKAAGMKNLLAVATIGCTMTLFLVVLTVSLTLQRNPKGKPNKVKLLATDVASLSRPTMHLIVVAVVLDVVSTEASVDWGQLASLLGFLMLGMALAISGVIGDILSHLFLRMDNHIVEGDFIIYDGGLVQIAEMKWRHTIGITDAHNAVIYIPNSELTGGAIVNQSQDNDRCVEVDFLVNMDAAQLRKAVANAWDLLAQTEEEDFTFTGLDGVVYTNQFNTPECAAWVQETCDSVHLKFTGAYYFSEPPPFDGDGEVPPWIDRQEEWEQGWQMQVEWFNIQLKIMNEELGAWPYYPEDPMRDRGSKPAAEVVVAPP